MSHRSLAQTLNALVTLGLVAGCGASDREWTEDVGRAEASIKGGYAAPDDTSTVGIFDYQGGLCSGSLIAPNLVLTARHCVSTTLNGSQGVICSQTKFGSPHQASSFFVTTGPYFTQNASDYHPVREVVTLPDVGSAFCGNDQAILILDENIDPSEAVPYTPRVDSGLVAGEEYYAVGFGATSDSQSAPSGTRRRRDGLFIDCVATECPSFYTQDTEWIGDTGICSGDSGGPALDLKNRVIGVTSRGPAGCEDPVYGYVYGWAEWIKSTAVYAAGLGGYAPPSWATGWPTDPEYSAPIGDACALATDCVSGRCIDTTGTGGYCTRLCNAQSPCGEGWTCDEATLGVCVKNAVPVEEEVPKKKKPAVAADGGEGGCTVGPSADPTKPIPWFIGAVAALAIAGLRRRRPSGRGGPRPQHPRER